MSIAYANGAFMPIDQPTLPIDERGHQFGDGVYEVIRVYQGKPFMMEEHLQRLAQSATAIQLQLNDSLAELKKIITEGIQRSGLTEAEVYIQVTRGIAPRKHLFPDVPASTTMTVRQVRSIPASYQRNGVDVLLLEDERWANCHIKSLNLLPNLLAKQKAHEKGCFEAIFIKDGQVTEGSSSNVFVVKEGQLLTTPLSKKILPGITRQAIIQLAHEMKLIVQEEDFSPAFLQSADEVFITSTTAEVMPVKNIEGQQVGNGRVGPITQQLQEAYWRLVQ